MFTEYLKAFLVGGAICAIGQVLIDYTKLTPARILVSFVCAGVILGGLGLYQPLIDFAGAGASVPLTGFGALLAKGRLLGIQFDTLFTDGLYFQISRHAIEMAEQMKKGFRDRGLTFYLESPTNQQFLILKNSLIDRLKKHVDFSLWEKLDENRTVARFATSWATTEAQVGRLMEILDEVMS